MIILYIVIKQRKKNMQKNKVNIVVFDQNQSVLTDQSRANYSTTRRPTGSNVSNPNQPQSLTISNQITSLNQKISFLQQRAQKIQQILKQCQNNNNMSQINTSINTTTVNSIQIEQLLKIVQKKIQIVVQETKKIIQKITGQFDRKINKCLTQKQHQNNSIVKIQNHCRDTITKIQQSYQQEINRIRNQHINLQNKMIQRVQQVQIDYKRKLKDFHNKQQQYVKTIEHLENKIKTINKSKKMIEVTQQRPPASTIRTQNIDNMSNISSQHTLPAHDTSKRRTRIFDSNRSVSPNNPSNQVLSPLKTQNNIKKQEQNVKIPKPQQKYMTKNMQVPPLANNYIAETKHSVTQPYQIRATVIPNQQSNVPKKPVQDYLSENNIKIKQKKLEQASSKQFFKDAPKVHWERFQDFNEDQNQSSDQDVFFYPQRTKEQPKSVFQTEHNNNSMHSPFDFN